MSNSENTTNTTAQTGPSAVTPLKPADVFFGADAVSFAAFMTILKAQQTEMTDYAKLNASLADQQSKNTIAQAQATYDAGQQDKKATEYDAYQSIVTGGTSVISCATAAVGAYQTKQAAKHVEGMEDLVKHVNAVPKSPRNTTLGDPLPPGPNGRRQIIDPHTTQPREMTDAEEAHEEKIDAIADQIVTKRFNYHQVAGKENPLDIDVSGDNSGITLKAVLERAQGREALKTLQTRIGQARYHASKEHIAAQKQIEANMQIGSSVGQVLSGFVNAPLKMEQAKAQAAKAIANMQGTYAQTNLSMVQENRQAAAKFADTLASNQASFWGSVGAMNQAATRG